MPFFETAAGAAAISGAASLLGAGGQAIATGKLNKKNRRWQEQMFRLQNQQAIANWQLQNQYNSPAAQMQRFRDAGLNPNLIYGQGTAGNAGDISVGKPGNPDTSVPDIGAIGQAARDSVFGYYDLRMKNAQITNQEKVNEMLALEETYKSLRNTKLFIDSRLGQQLFDHRGLANPLARSLMESSLQVQALQMDKVRQDMMLALNADERAAVASSRDLFVAIERVALMRAATANTKADQLRIYATVRNLKADTALKELDRQLKATGVQPSDHLVARLLARHIGPYLLGDKTPNVQPGNFIDWFRGKNMGKGSVLPNPYKK